MAPPYRFAKEVESRHIHFEPGSWNEIYIVGDIHGCAEELEALHARLTLTNNDLLVFVGDLISKGPESRRVVEYIRSLPNAVSVRGNNEQNAIESSGDFELAKSEMEFLETLPVVVTIGADMVVHGGIDPRKDLDEQMIADLIETRSLTRSNGYTRPYWFEQHTGPPRVFFGHTVFDAPLLADWSIGLDTGCVYGGRLTAYSLKEETVHSVSARRTYSARDESGVVSPSNTRVHERTGGR